MLPTILTATGNYFSFVEPEKSDFTIYDIAYALSHICRFTGHCTQFYSVAQHSVLVSEILPAELAMQGLLHDGAEAFVGDVSRPLKAMLPQYKEIERRVEKAVLERFGLPIDLDPKVKEADVILLATEKRDIMPRSHDWQLGSQPLTRKIEPVSPQEARDMFILRYEEILNDTH